MVNTFTTVERVKAILFKFNLRLIRVTRNVINYNDYDLIIDVGANIGQYGAKVRQSGYLGLIYSFEPQLAAHNILSTRSKLDNNWIIEEPCALGARNGELDLKVSKNSYSSSLLDVNATHLDAEINSRTVSSEIVKLRTLDSFLSSKFLSQEKIFLKLDVQGFELETLIGARMSLARVFAIQIELSTTELYEGQAGIVEILTFLNSEGFEIWDIENGFRDLKSGRLLQFDALFRKVE